MTQTQRSRPAPYPVLSVVASLALVACGGAEAPTHPSTGASRAEPAAVAADAGDRSRPPITPAMVRKVGAPARPDAGVAVEIQPGLGGHDRDRTEGSLGRTTERSKGKEKEKKGG